MIGPNASTPSLPHKASWLFAEKGNWLENMAALVYKACVLGVWHCTEVVYNIHGCSVFITITNKPFITNNLMME